MFNPNDVKQPDPGDRIALLVGNYDPPTMDYYRAIEALLSFGGIKNVWLCPLKANDDIWAMTNSLAVDFCVNGRPLTACLLKNKTPTDYAAWARKRYPELNFTIASVEKEEQDSEKTIFVKIGNEAVTTSQQVDVLVVDKFVPMPIDLKDRIKGGSDEARCFIPAIWNYIQKHKLYRD
jgi:nicotinic acid mononucleotide adenylyltransferase